MSFILSEEGTTIRIRKTKQAFVTLATTDEYALGALVLAESLKQVGTEKDLVCMTTADGISPEIRGLLEKTYTQVVKVNPLDSRDHANLDLLGRADLGITFTKLNCWRLTRYEKGVFLDADTMVVQNIDDLFEREEFSASPDPGWPDCFNSGVFVFRPSEETYASLIAFALQQGSFDGGDQGLLNMYFNTWATKDISRHLPFVYNCVSQAFYSYLPAFTHFQSRIRVLHFIGPIKPWHHSLEDGTARVIPRDQTGFSQQYLQHWFNILIKHVLPKLDADSDFVQVLIGHALVSDSGKVEEGLIGRLARIDLPQVTVTTGLEAAARSSGGSAGQGNFVINAPFDRERQYAWERNEIDYTGQDRFENILSKINDQISKK
jgi:glycogenin glucosyltransferase